MAEGHKQATLEVGTTTRGKEKKIEDYFGVRKNQKPEAENTRKLEEAMENNDILKAEKELKSAREKYVSANFETKNALDKIKKFLLVKGDLGNKEALDLKHTEYKNKRNELLSLKIGELKSQNPGKDKIGEKMKDLMESFSLNEEENLHIARAKFGPQQEGISNNHERITPKNIGPAPESLPDSAGDDYERNSAVILENLMECIKENAAIFGKKWEGIRGMNVYRIIRDMNWRKNNEMNLILRKLQETLGENVRPGGLETLENWLERLSKLAREKGK